MSEATTRVPFYEIIDGKRKINWEAYPERKLLWEDHSYEICGLKVVRYFVEWEHERLRRLMYVRESLEIIAIDGVDNSIFSAYYALHMTNEELKKGGYTSSKTNADLEDHTIRRIEDTFIKYWLTESVKISSWRDRPPMI